MAFGQASRQLRQEMVGISDASNLYAGNSVAVFWPPRVGKLTAAKAAEARKLLLKPRWRRDSFTFRVLRSSVPALGGRDDPAAWRHGCDWDVAILRSARAASDPIESRGWRERSLVPASQLLRMHLSGVDFARQRRRRLSASPTEVRGLLRAAVPQGWPLSGVALGPAVAGTVWQWSSGARGWMFSLKDLSRASDLTFQWTIGGLLDMDGSIREIPSSWGPNSSPATRVVTAALLSAAPFMDTRGRCLTLIPRLTRRPSPLRDLRVSARNRMRIKAD